VNAAAQVWVAAAELHCRAGETKPQRQQQHHQHQEQQQQAATIEATTAATTTITSSSCKKDIRAEGAITPPLTLSEGVLFAS